MMTNSDIRLRRKMNRQRIEINYCSHFCGIDPAYYALDHWCNCGLAEFWASYNK